MRHKFLVLPVKKWLKLVHIYGSYRKIKTGVPLFWTTLYSCGRQYSLSEVIVKTCIWSHFLGIHENS